MTIYTTAGVPIDRDWWHGITLEIAERKAARKPMHFAADATGKPVFRTVRERLHQFDKPGEPNSGDIMRVYRGLPMSGRYWHSKYSGEELRMIRARNGVGRPVKTDYPKIKNAGEEMRKFRAASPMRCALVEHGGQRAAARALGLNLSTFQRRLAKEAA